MSASSSPFDPFDTAPIGYTRARPASRALARISAVTLALSFTGVVFGMHATAVKPPATADAVPVATVSLCSCPGSRRCTCMSMRPGHDDEAGRNVDDRGAVRPADRVPTCGDPVAVDQDVERAVDPVGRIDDAPALKQLLHVRLRRPAGSSTAIRTATPLATWSRITEYGPSATSEAISTPRFIGPGCMIITSGLAQLQPRLGHPEHVEVLAQRREVRALHALELNPQQHDDVGVAHRFVARRCVDAARRTARCRSASASAARTPTRRRPSWSADGCSSAARGCAAGRRRWRPSAP